jgi:hypothetical protein
MLSSKYNFSSGDSTISVWIRKLCAGKGANPPSMDDFSASLEGLSRRNMSTGAERAAAVRTTQAQEVIVDGLNFLSFFCPSKEPGYAGKATPWELFATTHMRVRAFLRGCKLANLKPTFVLGKSPLPPRPSSPPARCTPDVGLDLQTAEAKAKR